MNTLIKLLAVALVAVWAAPTGAADNSKVGAATDQVQSGARAIGQGEVGQGVKETAKGVGNTVVEGAKYSGEKVKEAGKAAGPQAKTTWDHVKDGASSFGQSVKTFVTDLFSD